MSTVIKGREAEKAPPQKKEIWDKFARVQRPILNEREEWRNSEIGQQRLTELLKQLKSKDKEERSQAAKAIGDLGYWKAIDALLDTLKQEKELRVKKSIVTALSDIGEELFPEHAAWAKELISSGTGFRTREMLIDVIKKENDIEIVEKAAIALGYYYIFWGDAEKILTELHEEAEAQGRSSEILRAIWGPISENAVR
ncbi:MAG: HEAT repeat domain-containing protein [Candidatus Micrarchaeia archaeon]